MDFASALQAVSTVGFPIVICFVLLYFILLFVKEYKEIVKEHKEETKQLADAVNNNSLVIQQMCDKLEFFRRDD